MFSTLAHIAARRSPIHHVQKASIMIEAAVTVGAVTVGALGAGAIAATSVFYKVAHSDQYIVKTGAGIENLKISKTAWVIPFIHRYEMIHMRPKSYKFKLDAMSSGKMKFYLPGVFTVGPRVKLELTNKDIEAEKARLVKPALTEKDRGSLLERLKFKSLSLYAQYLLGSEDEMEVSTNEAEQESCLEKLIRGMIEGETRVLAAQMSIEKIFNDRVGFKAEIIANIQEELDQYGLEISNANIEELMDIPGSSYFDDKQQKILRDAEAERNINIADAKKNSDVREKELEVETRKRVAQQEADAVQIETETQQQIANYKAELFKVQAEADQKAKIARYESDGNSEIRQAEKQREAEAARLEQITQLEKVRLLAEARATAAKMVKDAEGKADAGVALAEGNRIADIKFAEGQSQAVRIMAEATLFKELKEAEAIQAKLDAQAEGNRNLVNAFGDDLEVYIRDLMIKNGQYTELAHANAAAIRGAFDKINYWHTAPGNGDSGNMSGIVQDLMKNVPAVASMIHNQTGKSMTELFTGLNNSSNVKKMDITHSDGNKTY